MGKSNWMKEQKGNFSNKGDDTFNPRKGYIGVRLQQGVPLLDRDWNELEDIRRYEEQMLREHYIGDGSPDDGFKIVSKYTTNEKTIYLENNFKISAGRFLVDGLEVVNRTDILYTNQEMCKDQKIEPPYKPPPYKPPDTGTREDTVYLDVWIEEEEMPVAEDIGLKTTLRHKLMWCVKVDEGSKGEYKIKESKDIDILSFDYKCKFDNGGMYNVVNIFGDEYVLLRSNYTNKLAKLVLNSDDKIILKTGKKHDLGSGYTLEATKVEGKKVTLEFSRKEVKIGDKDISTVSNGTNSGIWEVKLNGIESEDYAVLRVHVNPDFQGTDESIAQIDCIWLIDYVNSKTLNVGDIFGDYIFMKIELEGNTPNKLVFKEKDYHHYCDLAKITREAGVNEVKDIKDLRKIIPRIHKEGYIVNRFMNASGFGISTGEVVKLKGTSAFTYHGDIIPVFEVKLTDKVYDTSVIGIVDRMVTCETTDKTSVPDGEEFFVVTHGIYRYCKVNNKGGNINVGDLLTSSGNGFAQKATDDNIIGSIIGKALEPFNKETGYIAVFVNIQ